MYLYEVQSIKVLKGQGLLSIKLVKTLSNNSELKFFFSSCYQDEYSKQKKCWNN